MATLRYLGVLLAGAALAAAGGASAQELDRGHDLYENHCRFCHEDWAHTRNGRKITAINELRSRVASWSVHAGLHWTTEEVEDVVRYLNVRFYQFSE